MANVVTINRPEVVAPNEEATRKLTARKGSLFGAHPGSVRVREGVDLTAAALDTLPDAETGKEIER